MRLEAARARLAAHHSSPFNGMGGGGGGGKANGGRGRRGGFPSAPGGGDMQAARRFLLSLFGDATNGGNRGAGQRGGGGGARQREGEWPCQCGFANRAHRTVCYACGRPRPLDGPQQPHGGKGQSAKAVPRSRWASNDSVMPAGGWADGKGGRGANGPIGADGRRPMLGSHGGTRDSPTHPLSKSRGKAGWPKGDALAKGGPSQGKGPGGPAGPGDGAQRTARTDGGGQTPMGGGGKGAWCKPPRSVDADGYTLVQPRKVWQGAAEAAGPRDGAGQTMDGLARATPPTRARWADEEEGDGDDYMLDDVDAEDAEDAEERQARDEDDDGQRLRTKYEAYAKAVRDMEKKTHGGAENPALDTLREARDQAEAAWREAKTPAPLPIRMGRAQTKLDKAEAALTRARHAVDDFDEWADAQRKALLQRVDDADQWYRWRQHQMDELHEEASERVHNKAGTTGADTGRNAAVSERIMGGWLPALQDLLEHVQGNPEIEEKLASITADMQNAGQELAAGQTGTAEQYDIGDDDHRQRSAERGNTHDAQGDSSAIGRGAPRATNAGWRPEGPGRWARTRGDGERDNATNAGLADNCVGGHDETPHAVTAEAAGSANQAATAAPTGNKRGAADPPAEAKEPVRQKTDTEAREEMDRRRAAELLQQQQHAIAAQQASHDAGAGGFGSETAQSVAAQHFLAQVCKAVEQARTMGIEPRSGTKQLVELTPMELKQWVDEHIGDANSWA